MISVDNEYHLNLNLDELSITEKSTTNPVIVKEYKYKNSVYKIIKYNKPVYNEMDFDEKLKYLNLRSCILLNNNLVVFSPPKSIDFNKFTELFQTEDSYSEDFIDGTMINLFYNNESSEWTISTRSAVGGNNRFYDDCQTIKTDFNINKYNISFRELFYDTCKVINFNPHNLPKEYSYCFVVQHPLNRIVTPVSVPQIYLVKIVEIFKINMDLDIDGYNNNTLQFNIKNINLQSFYEIYFNLFNNSYISFPKRYNIDNFNNINNYFTHHECPYYLVGTIIYNKSGIRSKIRNPNYNNVKLLRGNHPKLQYNFLCLKRDNKIREFLNYYPEHYESFEKYRTLTFEYTNNLYKCYVSCYIYKQQELKNFPFEYKTHMFKLHKMYKDKLKNQKRVVDKKIVIDYVNNLHPAQQMFVINYSNYNNNS
tara:strand:- start:473 stop:1741 length:1269 start_codon:yes stop_codon:yes gene_type:complete